jgi:hypothetical protein
VASDARGPPDVFGPRSCTVSTSLVAPLSPKKSADTEGIKHRVDFEKMLLPQLGLQLWLNEDCVSARRGGEDKTEHANNPVLELGVCP